MSHVVRDERGVAWIDDTNVKVVEIALDHLDYGWSGRCCDARRMSPRGKASSASRRCNGGCGS